MSNITNQTIIQAWGNAPQSDAERHGDEGDFARQHLLNPALFTLLGDVNGKQILDAGCGQGYLCRMLAKRGAIVTGVEPAEVWYRYSVKREQNEPLSITYIQEDLSTFTTHTNTFDIGVANMVFMDIPDYETATHNCITSLKQGGTFIFSVTHPCFEEAASEWNKKRYVAVQNYLNGYTTKSGYGYAFHRPLSSYLNLVIREGCSITRVVEPQLSQEIVQQYGTLHERNVYVPQFLIVACSRL
jgi:SAM-dependent methyltransferase